MIERLINYLKEKKILILGFGREGQSTYKLIRKYLADKYLWIADKKVEALENSELLSNDNNIELISGDGYLDNLDEYDLIIKAPGVSLAQIDTSNIKNKISSQLELTLKFFKLFTIGVTGTKGKSTTSSLIYKILKDQNVRCELMGNIGIPIFDTIDEIKKGTTLVLELSSHQLEFVTKSPNIAILLNISPEHLDHYKSFDDYANAKCNIYKNQSGIDWFFYGADNDVVMEKVCNPNGKVFRVSMTNSEENNIFIKDEMVYFNDEPIYGINEPRTLKGDFNLNNIMFALGVAKVLELDMDLAKKSIAEFKSLPHRLEHVGTFDGVDYYDNCIGTVPMATIEAIKALKNVDTLIIGGMDRGIDYSEFIQFLNNSNISNIVCMPKTGHDIAKKLNSEKSIIVETLEEAVEISKKVTKKGMSCLISPTAASYGFFKNFEEKGDRFQELVKSK